MAKSGSSVSILVPSYNPGSFLATALDSVLSQDTDVEVVVQDACSDQETRGILDSFSDRVSLHIEPDRGQADALNKAFCRSSGDIIGWLNADDIYYPGAIGQVLDAFSQDERLDVVYGDYALIDSGGAQLRRYYIGPWDWKRFYRLGCYVFSGATFFRRRVLGPEPPFDPSLHYCMDYDLFLRIASSATAQHIPSVLGALRVHPGSKSIGGAWKFLPEAYHVRRRYATDRASQRSAMLVAARDAVVIAAQPIRYSRTWARLRPARSL